MASTINASTSGGLVTTADTSGVLQLQTANTTAVTIDASQNVGVGVTPSLWSVGRPTLEFGGSVQSTIAFNGNASNGGAIWTNAYYDGQNRYKANGAASRFDTSGGGFGFFTAPSGTAGNVITFTQAMTLDVSGNLGIGTNSPSYSFHVVRASGTALGVFERTSGALAYIEGTTSTGVVGTGSNHPLLFTTNSNERARITSGGNFGVGTTDPQATIVAAGSNATVYKAMILRNGSGTDGSSATLDFETSTGTQGSEAAMAGRIAGLRISSGTSGALTFSTTSGGTLAERARITDGGEFWVARTTDAGAYNIQCGGTGVWGAGAYVNGSDARIKEEIAPIDSGLDVVQKLNPVTYKYKEDWTKDRSTQTGFIAQELQVALEGKNYVDGIVQQGGSEGYYSVAYQNIIPILTKAIQELKAELDQAKAEIATLKGA